MAILRRAFSYFWPDRARIGVAVGLVALTAGANLLKPWPVAWIIDSVLGEKPLPNFFAGWTEGWADSALLSLFVGILWLSHVAQGIFTAAQNFTSIQVGLNGLARVRREVYGWLQRLSLRAHSRAVQGDLIYRASWDTYAFQTLFQQGLFTALTAALSLGLMLVIMWRVNERLTLVALLILPFLFAVMKTFGRRMQLKSLKAHQADSLVSTSVHQTAAALPLIQSYTREKTEESKFNSRIGEAWRRRLSQHRSEVVYSLSVALVFASGAAAITWLGAKQVMSGALTVGELWIFLAYLAQLYEPMNQLSHLRATVSDATAGVQRVFELLDQREVVEESPNPIAISGRMSLERCADGADPDPARTGHESLRICGRIEFQDVSFGYDPSRPVLRSVNFALAPGTAAAVIGPSGSGKTTLLQLLPRFYDPSSGRITLDAVDLRELRLEDLRASVAFVMQEPILLPGSVAENIGYGRAGATRDEIEAAAKGAYAHEFINGLEAGYETVIGEGGARLSVGEKQRISLARAFLKDAPVLLLDEPTSALDVESEEQIVAGLRKLMEGRTTIVVAHRLSTIERVDQAIVLENGEITQIGSPEELMAKPGYWRRVWQRR